jgi:intracellular multiplication protein IcmV
MGFFSGAKNLGSYVFNFRVTKWLDYDFLKRSTNKIMSIARSAFSPEQAERTETFEQAMERLNLTENELQQRLTEFSRLLVIYIFIAIAIFTYSVWIVFTHKNIMGFFMGFCITIFALSHAFRYHFWIYQIKHRKLGCSLREWFFDN